MWSYYLYPVFFSGSWFMLNDSIVNSLIPASITTLLPHTLVVLYSLLIKTLVSSTVAYLPTYLQTSLWSVRGGKIWPSLQKSRFWSWFQRYFDASITLEEPLNHDQQYIFGCFPHGPITVNHMMTMTDCCGMFSKHFKGDRRDLAASILMYLPLVKDVRNSHNTKIPCHSEYFQT